MPEYEIELHRQSDQITIGPDDYKSVRFPNSHTAIDEFEIELPPSEQWEWWAEREGAEMVAWVLEDGQRKYADPQYRGIVDTCKTSMEGSHPVDSTVLRGQDITVQLRREGGADRRFQGVLGHEAIRTYVNEELSEFDWTVVEPSSEVIDQDNVIQGNSVDFHIADFASSVETDSGTVDISDGDFSKVPIEETTNGIQAQQVCFTQGHSERTDDSGVTFREDTRYSGNWALGLDSVGNYIEWTFTTEYDMDEFQVWWRGERRSQDDGAKIEFRVDGTTLGSTRPSTSLDWSSPTPDTTLQAGTHTLRIECVEAGINSYIDVVAPLDSAFFSHLDLDNDTTGDPGYLTGPQLYPNLTVNLEEEVTGTDIVRGDLTADISSFHRDNQLRLSHDGSEWRPAEGDNSRVIDNSTSGTTIDVEDVDEVRIDAASVPGDDGVGVSFGAGVGGGHSEFSGVLDVSDRIQITVYSPDSSGNGYSDGGSAVDAEYAMNGGTGGASAAVEVEATRAAEAGGGGGGGGADAGGNLDDLTYNNGAGFTNIEDIAVHPNGSRFYWADYTNTEVVQEDLGTAWDITTSSNVESQGLSEISELFDIGWGDDGNRFYALDYNGDNPDLHEYTASTPYDVTTISHVQSRGVGATFTPTGFVWAPDGETVILCYSAGGSPSIQGYDVPDPWRCQNFDKVFGSSDLSDTLDSAWGMTANYDGSKAYVCDESFSQIAECTGEISDPTSYTIDKVVDVSGQSGQPRGMASSPDMAHLYHAGIENDNAYWYGTTTYAGTTGGDGGGPGGAGGDSEGDGSPGDTYIDTSFFTDYEDGWADVDSPGTVVVTTLGVDVDYSNTPTGTIQGRARFGRTGHQESTPAEGFQTQELTNWRLAVDLTNIPVFNDRRYTGSDFENLVEMHEDVGMVFSVEPSALSDPIPATSLVPDDVERSADWTETSHDRNVQTRGYANIQRVYGPLRDDGTRLEVEARASDEIDLVGEVPAEPVTRPNLTNSNDLEGEARKLLSSRVRDGDRVRGDVRILPKHVAPGFSYQVPEFGDTRVLNVVELTDGIRGPEGILRFEQSDDFLDVVDSIQTELRTTRQIL